MNKTVWGVVLVVIIVVAVVLMVRRTTTTPKGGAYYEAYNKLIKVYDLDDKKVVEVKQGVWEQKYDLDKDTGYRTGPGGHKIAIMFQSAATGEMIPYPALPVEATEEQRVEVFKNYKDEASGKSHFPPEMLEVPQ